MTAASKPSAMAQRVQDLFDLSGRVAIITGGAGLLGRKHAEIIAAAGGCPVILDLPDANPQQHAQRLFETYNVQSLGVPADVSNLQQLEAARDIIIRKFGRLDVLINNAANNPKVASGSTTNWSRLANFPLEVWEADLRVGLTGAFLCSRVFGTEMANRRKGVIVNVASDLALIAPDQRLYRIPDIGDDQQPVKPVTYSVVKTGLLGLTRYLATYWAEAGVRVNAISPGGVYDGQPETFVARLRQLIPLGRMASADEYQGAILFLCSDASSYMTGANLIIDGGRSCW